MYVLTRFSLMAGESAPRINFWAALVNSGRPAMGRYSWFRFGSLRRISSACLILFFSIFYVTYRYPNGV